MKRKIAAFLMFFVLLAVCLVRVSAVEEVYTENIRAINEGVYTLNLLMDGYSESDADEEKSVAIRTNAVVVGCVNAINDLRADARVSSDDLTDEVALLVLKGEVLGACAWEFESHAAELSEVARERVRDIYEISLETVADAVEYEALSERSGECISAVIVAIYEEKTSALCGEGASPAVVHLASTAIREMSALNTVRCEDYEQIYQRAAREIGIQRNRELAILRFSLSYDKINGAGSFDRQKETDEDILYFLHLAGEADTVESFNQAIEKSILSVIDSLVGSVSGEYMSAILSDTERALAELSALADSSGEILDSGELLDGISKKLLVAEKKDLLVGYAQDVSSAYLSELLEEYNRDGGIFESASDERVAEFLLKQAKLRVDWCAECERYMRLSASFFGGQENEEIAERFEELYYMVDSEMLSAQTLEGAREAAREGRRSAESLCFEFEAEAYLLRHSALISMPLSDVTRADSVALRAAVLDYISLSESAQMITEADVRSLCRKYRAALADHLYYIANGDGDMRIALEYRTLIDATDLDGDSERFVGFCEVLVKKAESEMRICEMYKEITEKDAYVGFSDRYKNALRECRDGYLSKVREMPLESASPDIELGIIRRSAELEMLRAYCEALISSFAMDDDSTEVSGIIASALADLRFADSTEELEAAVTRSELAICRQRGSESLTALKTRTDGALELLGYLGAERQSEYRAQLAELLSEALGALGDSRDMEAAVGTLAEYEAQMSTLYENARAEDLVGAGAWAGDVIGLRGEELLLRVENMTYIDSEIKNRLIAEARDLTSLALQNAELAASAEDVEFVVFSYTAETEVLLAEAESCELEGARATVMTMAERETASAERAILALTYLSETRAQEISSAISDELAALTEQVGAVLSVEAVEERLDEFLATLREITSGAVSEDLRCAVATLSESVERMKEGARERIEGTKYLSAADLSEYKRAADAICESSTLELSGAQDVAAAERIWQSAKESYGALVESLDSAELASACGQAADALNEAAEQALSEILSLGYLSETRKAALSEELDELIAELSEELSRAETPEAVEARLSAEKEKIKALTERAVGEDLAEARSYYTAALDERFSSYREADYTPQRYAVIKDRYEAARVAIATAGSAESISDLFFGAERSMADVVSIFEDKKTELAASLNSEYSELLKMSAQYSKEALARLGEIRQSALEGMDEADASIGLSGLVKLADTAIADMRAVGVEWISSGRLNADSSGFAEYPAGYDYSVGGIWGLVSNADGLPSDLRLSISLTEGNRGYKNALRAALAESRIAYVGESPMSDSEIYERLDGLVVKGVFSVKLIRSAAVYDEFSGEYTVRILLPQNMRSERTLRVVYISPDGDAEYYDAVCEEGMLVFRTTHFSDFILLGERRVDLLPIIALFALLGVIEGIALIAIRGIMRKEETRLASLVPFAALSVITPSGGVAMAAVLLAIDLTLGVFILLSARELAAKRRETREARVYALPIDFDDAEECAPIEAPEGFSAMLPAYLESVSAEDADSLIEDSKVSALLIRSEIAPRVCRGCKKSFINVDTLSDSFERGETVSLETLRAKGLVPISACYIKVLARGVIDKPLTVRAQSFSANAVKMITLTGGRAILEGSDREE